jgi:hypothetical protein
MSSPTFIVSVKSIEGKKLTLRIRATGAGDIDDMVLSRSFVFDCFQEEEWVSNALTEIALEADIYDTKWLQENLDQYIEKTELGEYRNKENQSRVEEVFEYADDVSNRFKRGTIAFEDEVCKQFPNYDLIVTMADEKWLEGVEVNACGESTSYDIWYEDPKSAKV